ncbi:MAG: ABC transporter substrate-binding protein [Deltaproteobacteria bacterium]|nr:ABC transporter substrate-binding protein [Deltaproteobacteria bacterium]
MAKKHLLPILLGLLISWSPPIVHAAETLRAASGGFTTAIHAVLWGAYEQKLFRKYGPDVEYLALNSGRLGMQMMLSDDVQVLFSTGVTAVTTNLSGGNLAIIAGGLNFFPNKLIVRPEIKRAADLKTKVLAVGGFGAANHTALLVSLEKLGVNVKDVTIIQIAGAAAQLGALVKGVIHGLMFNEPQASIAIKKFGMQSLLDMSEIKTPFPQNSFIVKRNYLESNRDKVVGIMKAVTESIYMLKRDRPLAIRLIKKYIRVNDEEAGIGYDYYLAKHAEGILELPDRRGLQFVIDDIAKTNPKAVGQTPESLKVLEPSVLDEIKKSGFVEKVR